MTRFILATYSHRHGEDHAAFHDDDAAEAFRQRLADQYWSDIMEGEKPADPAEAADAYFDRSEEIGDEFFSTQSMEIEGVPADPVRDAAPALLAALRKASEYVDSELGWHGSNASDELRELAREVDAAIAAAEGRS